jgi:hypothetical protein
MRKFLIFALILATFMIIAGTVDKTDADALYDAVGDTTIMDTFDISNDKFETPYIGVGYHSYGQTLSNDTAPIFKLEVVPCFATISDSLQSGAAVTLATDTITKNANCNKTTAYSLSSYFPAYQTYIVRLICLEIDVSDTDSIGARLYLTRPTKK